MSLANDGYGSATQALPMMERMVAIEDAHILETEVGRGSRECEVC